MNILVLYLFENLACNSKINLMIMTLTSKEYINVII